MKVSKFSRHGHSGKDPQEKEAYRQFLASKFPLAKTEEDPADLNKTDESTFEEEQIESVPITKTSFYLKTKDLLNDNWVVTIIGGLITSLIVLAISGYISLNREQGIQGEKVSNIEKKIVEFDYYRKDIADGFALIKENLSVFQAETSKDIEYLHRVLGF